jgi:hypothetical protein
MYRYELLDSHIGPSGLQSYLSSADAMAVDGVAMVRTPHGAILPAHGWKATKQEAALAAAERIEAIVGALQAQAERMRSEAASQ